MPGWSEVARYVHVSTYGSWDEVNRFYWALVKDQLRPTDEVRRAAERLAREAAAPRPAARRGKAAPEPAAFAVPPSGWSQAQRRAIVAAIYDFVVSQTRYVGLEFGIHGYKPYRVDDVLRRRFGDCKDKASLLHAMLEAVGVDSRLVLLRMKRLGRIPEAPASLAVFNHAIVYVPRLDLWLDGTASFSGSGELPGEDRGATVLVVNPDGPPRFGTIPEAGPDENRTDAEVDLRLSADGSAALQGRWRVLGVDAPGYRRSYGVEDGRRALLEQTMGQLFPGSRVESVSVSDLSRIEDDVDVRFAGSVPRCAQRDGDGLRFTPFGDSTGYVQAYASLSSRKLDLDLGGPRATRFRYRYALPPGWRVRELPEAARAGGRLGGFAVRYREENGSVVAEGEVQLPGGRIHPVDYPAFRQLMVEVDRAFARRIRVAPPPAGGKETP